VSKGAPSSQSNALLSHSGDLRPADGAADLSDLLLLACKSFHSFRISLRHKPLLQLHDEMTAAPRQASCTQAISNSVQAEAWQIGLKDTSLCDCQTHEIMVADPTHTLSEGSARA